MNTPPPSSSPPAQPSARLGLAIASFVLGILGLLASLVLVGGLLGLVGLILGAMHLKRRTGRNGFAWAGIGLSVLSVLASIGLGFVYMPVIKEAMKKVREMQGQVARQLFTDPDFAKWQGQAAPDFTMTTLDGGKIKLSELKGRRVVVDFWATWCPPCVAEIPHFVRLRNEVSTNELVIIGISTEHAPTLKAFVKKQGVNYPIAMAEELPSPFNDVQGIPTTFFIDAGGVIREIAVGYHDFEDLKSHALTNSLPAPPL
ncbi:MAG: TlpA family protein disulfide reductase [Pedosphaera sp.]|nr:TlpA family protein disulfide reductase [Pedosphaera sp.]